MAFLTDVHLPEISTYSWQRCLSYKAIMGSYLQCAYGKCMQSASNDRQRETNFIELLDNLLKTAACLPNLWRVTGFSLGRMFQRELCGQFGGRRCTVFLRAVHTRIISRRPWHRSGCQKGRRQPTPVQRRRRAVG
jgi:hypothetical protein